MIKQIPLWMKRLLLLGMGLISAWACMIAHNLLLFGMFMAYYLTGRWNPLNHPKEHLPT